VEKKRGGSLPPNGMFLFPRQKEKKKGERQKTYQSKGGGKSLKSVFGKEKRKKTKSEAKRKKKKEKMKGK